VPASRPELTADDVDAYVRDHCFAPSEEDRIGLELEWLTVDGRNDRRPASIERVRKLLGDRLPGGTTVTFEPGGQLELSAPPGGTVAEACHTAGDDLAIARRALAAEDVSLVGVGLDPVRVNRRVLDAPRYRAMEAYFDRLGDTGRTMMTRTAAVQVNLDVGHDAQVARRWHLAHTLGPALAAAFANSPLDQSIPSGWRSTAVAPPPPTTAATPAWHGPGTCSTRESC